MGWWKTAKPGDKVACVNDEWSGLGLQSQTGIPCPLVAGDVYTIERVIPSQWGYNHDRSYGPEICITLVEVKYPNSSRGFNIHRFRPVQTKSTDTGMAILKSILERPEQRIEEDA